MRRHAGFSWIGAFGFLVILSTFASGGGGLRGPAAVSYVALHMVAMAIPLLFCGMFRSEVPYRFGVRDLLALTAAAAVFGSLARICLRWIPFDNLNVAGKVSIVVVVIGTGWALTTVLAEVVASLVWWLVRYRRRQ